MEEKFLESQTNFTNFEIDLREMQGLMKVHNSKLFFF